MKTTFKAKPRFSSDPREDRIIRRAIRSTEAYQKQLENNELIPVTRVYADGRREKLLIRGHDILKRGQGDPEPMSREELKALREKMRMTQEALARWLMVSVATVRSWEQRTGLPRGPALRVMHNYRHLLEE